MPYAFQPQTCSFMLYGPFNQIINDQLQNLPFEPINGVPLKFQYCIDEYNQSVTVEIDPLGSIAKVSVTEAETISMLFDFTNDEFIHYGESLELICGHPLFHMLQKTFPAHYQAGHYIVTVTAL